MRYMDIEEGITIEVQRSEKTLETIKQLDNFINEMALEQDQNIKLIELATHMLTVAEEEAYRQGFLDCCKAVKEGGIEALNIIKTVAIFRNSL